jgi:beta-glucosidase
MSEPFRWGVATSSYQIEGAVVEDGRGPSIWDTFTHEPDRVSDGTTGDVACDHYHRYPEDVELMAGLGLGAYRFSIAWSRIQPTGTGQANPGGIAFYDRLVDTLLAKGIDPVATLYHWDLPQALQDAGGWTARETAYRFADYAGLLGAALGDRMKLWLTLNEPVIHTIYGHFWGMHAPGLQLFDPAALFPVSHHQLLGHGLAVAALRAQGPVRVGIANNYSPAWAVGPDGERDSATDDDRHAAAAFDRTFNQLYTDPILKGAYPDGTELGDCVRADDLTTIAAPIDALGVNYYNPTGVGAPSGGLPLPYDMRLLAGYPLTYFGWPVVPEGLHELLGYLRERYGERLPDIYVTESGCAYADEPSDDGTVDDQDRIAYLQAHVAAVDAAIAEGVPVRGYFVWSLMDNFEWAEGFSKRFGLVHVDFANQRRTPKASYAWYRDLIRTRS